MVASLGKLPRAISRILRNLRRENPEWSVLREFLGCRLPSPGGRAQWRGLLLVEIVGTCGAEATSIVGGCGRAECDAHRTTRASRAHRARDTGPRPAQGQASRA